MNNITQQNLYIKSEKFDTKFNFYNYNKFKLYRTIPISYRSPTFFLDGLYFELPYSEIIRIKKNNSMCYTVDIRIPITEESNSIKQLFKYINDYNIDFFSKNIEKFNLRVLKSSKRKIVSELNIKDVRDFVPKKNPLIKNYKYNNFYLCDDNYIYVSLNIKHFYLTKIFELANIVYPNNLNINHVLNFLNEDQNSVSVNYSLNEKIKIKFWIKSNIFLGNENDELINMIWDICDYKL